MGHEPHLGPWLSGVQCVVNCLNFCTLESGHYIDDCSTVLRALNTPVNPHRRAGTRFGESFHCSAMLRVLRFSELPIRVHSLGRSKKFCGTDIQNEAE